MNITGISYQPQVKSKLNFTGENKKPIHYIDRRTESRASMAAFMGTILGEMLIAIPLLKTALGNPTTKEAFQAAITKMPKFKLAGALIAALAGVVVPGFIAAKFWANKGKTEEEKLSNPTLLKLTGAALIGTTVGSKLAGLLTKRASGEGLKLIFNAIAAVMGCDIGVNIATNHLNKKAVKPTVNYIHTDQGLVVVQDFRNFVNKTQGLNY